MNRVQTQKFKEKYQTGAEEKNDKKKTVNISVINN